MALFCRLLFMQNLLLLNKLVVVLVARISPVRDSGGFNSAENTPPSQSFSPYWIFPRPTESWFEIHLH